MANFSGVKSKRTVSKFTKRKGKFCVVLTYFVKRVHEIRKFHIAAMQLWLRNVQKKVKHMQSCCFADINLLLFFHDPTSNADLFIVPTHLPTYLPTCLSVCLSKMHAVCNFKHCTLRLYGYVKSRYYAAMENVITFMRY